MDVKPWFNKDPRENNIEKFITHRSWRRCMASLKGSHGEIREGCRQSASIRVGSMGRVLLGFQS